MVDLLTTFNQEYLNIQPDIQPQRFLQH